MRVPFMVALSAMTLLGACGGAAPTVDPVGRPPAGVPTSAQPAAASSPATSTGSPTAVAEGPTATVIRVVDGDTLDVRLGGRKERVRLIGIDTPESVKPDSPVECFGPEASAHLAELLPAGTPVELARDAELRDPYDRLLAYVFRQSDGLFVNLSMAADGFAGTLSIAPNTTFADDLRAAVDSARDQRLGLWKACPDPDRLFS